MGLADLFRRLGRRMTQTDEERLAAETFDWACGIPGTVRIAEAPLRRPVRIAGIVDRLTVRPSGGLQSIEAVVSDGTAAVTAAWLGRTSIPGIELGTRLLLEGVLGETESGRRIVNPRFDFA